MLGTEDRVFRIHDDPEAELALQESLLIQIREECGEEEYIYNLRKLILEDLWFLNCSVLGFRFMDPWLHGQVLMRHYERSLKGNGGQGEDLATFIPRGHCKTTFGAGFFIQWILNDPNFALGIITGTERLAKLIAKLMADSLTDNVHLQLCFPDILPHEDNPAKTWGMKGYFLPGRTTLRADPTISIGSVTANLTGTHPDVLLADDIVFSDKESELEAAENAYIEATALCPPQGRIMINGTRWSDRDFYGKVIDGDLVGNLGEFNVLKLSCWKDEAQTIPIYPERKRNSQTTLSGFSRESLERRKKNRKAFFFCQYLNEPAPKEDQQMNKDDIQVFTDQDLPPFMGAHFITLEVDGPSKTFPEIFKKVRSDYHIEIQLHEINIPRTHKSDKVEKSHDELSNKQRRILNTCAPVIQDRRVFARDWMLKDQGHLGDEIDRFKRARHDDIIDTLHILLAYAYKDIRPQEGAPASCYIGADLAFSEEQGSDWTVFMAIVCDWAGRVFILDYKRFKQKDPMRMAEELIKFYQSVNSKAFSVQYNRKKKASRLARSYK